LGPAVLGLSLRRFCLFTWKHFMVYAIATGARYDRYGGVH
jgi:hypothetical protein